MTAETYLQHQANNQYKIRTDPLADLLDNLNKNPASYTSIQTADNITKGEQCSGQRNDRISSAGGKKHKAMHQKRQAPVTRKKQTIQEKIFLPYKIVK